MVGICPLLSLKSPPVWQWLYRGFCVETYHHTNAYCVEVKM